MYAEAQPAYTGLTKYKPTQVFSAHFSLTIRIRKSSHEITHAKIVPHQARLIVEFLANVFPWKKMHLVDMRNLSIIF